MLLTPSVQLVSLFLSSTDFLGLLFVNRFYIVAVSKQKFINRVFRSAKALARARAFAKQVVSSSFCCNDLCKLLM